MAPGLELEPEPEQSDGTTLVDSEPESVDGTLPVEPEPQPVDGSIGLSAEPEPEPEAPQTQTQHSEPWVIAGLQAVAILLLALPAPVFNSMLTKLVFSSVRLPVWS